MAKRYLVILFFALILWPVSSQYVSSGTVYYDGFNYTLKLGVQDKEYGAAYGSYLKTQNIDGWGKLHVAGGYATKTDYSDVAVVKAAGFLEGALTHTEIYSLYKNLYSVYFINEDTTTIEKVKSYYKQQRDWMTNMIDTNNSVYWTYINLIYQQFEGMKLGYRMYAPSDQMMEDWQFDYLAGNGDYFDIQNFIKNRSFDVSKMNKNEQMDWVFGQGHCSVLIKVLPGYENIYASHSSWYIYQSMVRVYKHYAFNLRDSHAASKVTSFSSYAGVLSSWDDFYIMDSKMMMLQTTNEISDYSIYKYSTPQSLFSWHRVRLANWLASNGKEWSEYVAEYNSGTYNNQYMVLDLKKINLTNGLEDGTLWVVEQIPGYVEYADQTAILREGYWASYNVPFYESIANKSGWPVVVATMGPDASHDLYPRAKIFRRDQGKVVDMETMKYLMRYNDYKNDPYSEGNPMNAICSRGDLQEKPSIHGCVDTKIADYYMALEMTSIAESGPTHQNLPPFQWSTSPIANASHLDQPDLYNFDFVQMKPLVP